MTPPERTNHGLGITFSHHLGLSCRSVEAIGEGVKNLSLSKEPLLRVLDQGANLAFTQRVRIEYALNGGRINIETAAGVDLSDRGVNLKILRGRLQNADCPSLLRRALNHAS